MSPARPRPLRALHDWWDRRSRVAKTAMLGGLAAGLLGLVAVAAIVYSAVRIPLPDTVAIPQQIKLTYTDGSTLDTVGQVNRTDVPLSAVPQPVRDAVLAAEDHNYYREPGVSVRGIGRALFADLTGGGIRQGGSTITQQYAKNAYLGQQRTFTRKIKEVVLAVKLSRRYSKDQILEFYLNTIYFGRGAYGIEAASQAYFGKPTSQLDAAQGAVLAGLIRAPGYLDPRVHPQAARDRWNQVLDQMVRDGALTDTQRQSTAYPATLGTTGAIARARNHGPTSYIDAQVDGFLRHRLGDDAVDLGGFTVTTTVDKTAQAAAEQSVADHTHGAPADLRVAVVSTDPGTGAVRAYYGGATAGQADAAEFLALPPGSSFKPIALAAALENGIPLTKTYDGSSPQSFNGTPVHNFKVNGADEQYGQIDLPTATAHSVNTVYMQLTRDAGPQKVVDLAHGLGVPDSVQLDPVPEVALGTTGVTALDMAKVYDAFAGRGKQAAPYLVDKVVDRNGNTVYQASHSTNQVISERTADDATYAMQQVLSRGTATADQLAGRPAAGKTGTVSNDVAAWFDGYTPQLSTVVGVFEPGPGGRPQTIRPYASCGCSEVTGATAAAPIWQQYMNAALAGKPVLQFPPPATFNTEAPTTSAPPTTSLAPTTTSSSSRPTSSAPPITTSKVPTTPPTSPPVPPPPVLSSSVAPTRIGASPGP